MFWEKLKRHVLMEALFPRFSTRRAVASRFFQRTRAAFSSARETALFAEKYGIRSARLRLSALRAAQQARKRADWHSESPAEELLPALLQELYPGALPRISVVSVLYNKEREVAFFLEALFRQKYVLPYEIVLVDDASPDQGVRAAHKAYERCLGRSPERPVRLSILENQCNEGNCASRNRGIAHARGEILLIIDADCIVNDTFLARHALALAQGPFDIGIGPCNIETGHDHPVRLLEKLEAAPETIFSRQNLQDPSCPPGFLNCVTRNFSIRREKIFEPLFDADFSYSAAPDSGFGWEDVDMGYRLYLAGLRSVFIPGAFSLHISHDFDIQDRKKKIKSLRNFAKLFRKHTELAFCVPKWARETCHNILRIEGDPVPPDSEDLGFLRDTLGEGQNYGVPLVKTGRARLRILTYHWHTTHQYELFKLPHDFFLVTDIGLPFNNAWDYERRPMPQNVRFVSAHSVRESEFDLAILPFDENVLSPENANGVLPPEWGNCFSWFLKNISLPKIGICHGTPQFYGQYDINYTGDDLFNVREDERLRLVQAVRDFPVVCNSYQAEKEWRFCSSHVVWHGFNPQEFRPKKPDATGVLCLNKKALLHRPFYNGYFPYREIVRTLPGHLRPRGIAPHNPTTCLGKANSYAWAKFSNYVDVLRSCSIYLNPTVRSPMPRTRSEAMLCGLVSVSLKNHDVDLFIRNEKNGFYSSDPEELRDYIIFCSSHPRCAREMGAASRATALKTFSLDRYLYDWSCLLKNAGP